MMLTSPRPIVQKLGFQIAFLLAVVLLPLTLISMVNSFRASTEMQARSEAALTGETLEASSSVVRQIQEARGSAATLASMIGPLINDDTACSAALHKMAELLPQYSLIAFIPTDGVMRCSSSDTTHDFSQSPIFKDLIAERRPSFSVNKNGPISETSVLGISHPVFDKYGTFLGIISLSLPLDKFALGTANGKATGPAEFMTYDRDGQVLVATSGLDTAAESLPGDHPLQSLISNQALSFSAISVTGQHKVFSVVPVVPGELYVLGTWPASQLIYSSNQLLTIPILASALTCIASLLVAWLSVEHLVNRHIRRLNDAIRAFAGGDRGVTPIDVKGAPLELREIASAYEQMTEAVMRDEAELENSVHQKEVLLREVHHRVKNNLQMIVSIMNMHMRKARTPETKRVIRGLQGRVISLAAIHRELYQTTEVTDILASDLMGSIARQALNAAAPPEHSFELTFDVEDIRMTPDQAIPLALLAGEAVMNAAKHSYSTALNTGILVARLKQDETQTAMLEVSCKIAEAYTHPDETEEDGVALGVQLMTAFAMQLGGSLHESFLDGQYRMRVQFKLRPLFEAEDRHSPNE